MKVVKIEPKTRRDEDGILKIVSPLEVEINDFISRKEPKLIAFMQGETDYAYIVVD